MKKEYVKKVEGAYRVGETRVSLDSLVFSFARECRPKVWLIPTLH